MLCTALNKKGFVTPYKSTHLKHPCVLWVEQSYDNFLWLQQLCVALNQEYRYRYAKPSDHKSMAVLAQLAGMQYPALGLTEFAQAMPEQYKQPGQAVQAYRDFYRGEKMAFARWTKRPMPEWL
jgi:hypothetical protein